MTDTCASIVGGWRSTHDAEHAFHARHATGSRATYAGTTFVAGARAAEVEVRVGDDPRDLPDGTRLFVFPGHHLLVGALAVGDLVSGTGIDEVRGLGGASPGEEELLDTQEFVRPHVEDGRVVLRVRPAAGDVLVPFEQRDPTPCCVDHA